MGWVVNATPRPIYPRERPGTHCTGVWVGPRAGLDGWGKFHPTPGFDPRLVQPVATRYTDWAIPVLRYTPYFKNKEELSYQYLYINNDSTLWRNKRGDSLRSIPFGRHTSLHTHNLTSQRSPYSHFFFTEPLTDFQAFSHRITRWEKNQLPGLPHDGWVYIWSRLTGIIAMVNTWGCTIIAIMSPSSINQITLASTEFFGLLFLLSRVLSRLFFLSCLNTQFVIHTHMNFSVQQSTRNNKSILHSQSAYKKSRRIHNFFLLQVTSNRLQQCPSMRHAMEFSGICQNFLIVQYQAWSAISNSV